MQQITEFEIAVYQDRADYVKILKPTNEFQKVLTLQYTQNIGLNPKAIWYKKKGLLRFLTRFSTQSYFQINRKVFESDEDSSVLNALVPLDMQVDDGNLVFLNSSIRNTLYFNRSSPVYAIDLSWLDNRNKQALISGSDSRTKQDYGLKFRWNISRKITLEGKYNNIRRTRNLIVTQNYDVRGHEIEPKVSLTTNKYRISVLWKYSDFRNDSITIPVSEGPDSIIGGEWMINRKLSFDFKYNVVAKSSLNSRFSYALVSYTGATNTPVAFVVLQGLDKGSNWLWNVNFETKLNKNLQLSLNYDGRKISDNKMVHVGSAQIRALF